MGNNLHPLHLAVLNCLACCKAGTTQDNLMELMRGRIGPEETISALRFLISAGLAIPTADRVPAIYWVTARGQELLAQLRSGSDAQIAQDAPLNVSVCNAQDAPATALVCVDEDELDEWWEEQGVDVKADAFMRWALNRDRCSVHIPETTRIPVEGIVGAAPIAPSAEDLDAIAEEQRAREATREDTLGQHVGLSGYEYHPVATSGADVVNAVNDAIAQADGCGEERAAR